VEPPDRHIAGREGRTSPNDQQSNASLIFLIHRVLSDYNDLMAMTEEMQERHGHGRS
jgi:hypothetical protein